MSATAQVHEPVEEKEVVEKEEEKEVVEEKSSVVEASRRVGGHRFSGELNWEEQVVNYIDHHKSRIHNHHTHFGSAGAGLDCKLVTGGRNCELVLKRTVAGEGGKRKAGRRLQRRERHVLGQSMVEGQLHRVRTV